MRRVIIALSGTIAALVMLFTYPTSTNRSLAATGDPDVQDTTGPPETPEPTPATTAEATKAVFTGRRVESDKGPVQVKITMAAGRIVEVKAVVYPWNSQRDREINARALPILAAAAVASQSAQLDAVSGATITSEAYMTSLQSAIDAAHA